MNERVEQAGTVAILGLGLMGGSLGLAVTSSGLAERVVGYDRDPKVLDKALGVKAISETAATVAEAVDGADLIFIATPVSAIPSVFAEGAGSMTPGAIVTDVGSTKSGVVDQIAPSVPAGVHFIGGHPMTGSEKEGIDAARADLYAGCLWILTPTEATAPAAYGKLVRFLTALECRVLALDPRRHDEALALTSHLPQLLSSTLMGFATDVASAGEGLPLLTAGGFKDMTRIAGSSPDLWVDIIRENRPAVLDLVRRFQSAFGTAAVYLEEGDWDGFRRWLGEARVARRSLAGKPGLAQLELIELLIPVVDKPGVLSDITTSVGEAGVNIEDLNIVHSAEGGRGVIHLSVSGQGGAEAAREALEKKGYTVEVEPKGG
jgi:prephenate dehydrogenase